MTLRKRIGVMVPSTNTTFEADFQLVAPRDITIHGQRLWLTNGDEGAAGMDRMNAEIESGAKYLATVNLEFKVRGQDAIGRQSQTWVRFPDVGCKVISAHVSVVPESALA